MEALKFSECLKCNKSYSCWVDIRYHCQTAHPEESEQLLEQIKQLNDEVFQTEEISVEKSAEKVDESKNDLSNHETPSIKSDQPNIKKEACWQITHGSSTLISQAARRIWTNALETCTAQLNIVLQS